jgi:NAD-dependent deacetylase
MKPIEFDAFMRSAAMRRETWRRRFAMEDMFASARPNDGHKAVAELVRRGIVRCVITQNIDNLHQASGVPGEKIVELHGNTTYATCLDCAKRYEIPLTAQFLRKGRRGPRLRVRRLYQSGNDLVRAGHARGSHAERRRATLDCDLFLVLGSSLVVYPAAGFPIMAKRNGAKLVILNRSPTDQDEYTDLVIREGIGATLSRALAELDGIPTSATVPFPTCR